MPEWTTVARATDLAVDASLAVEVAGHSLLVARLADGVFAIRNLCSHQAQPLQGGAICNGEIECPVHGARFDLRTGARRSMPAVVGVKAFPAREEAGSIQVDAASVIAQLGAPLD